MKDKINQVGLDVHKDSIAIGVVEEGVPTGLVSPRLLDHYRGGPERERPSTMRRQAWSDDADVHLRDPCPALPRNYRR